MAKKITYKDAFEELNSIAQSLESDNLEIDSLAQKIKRANELVKICKDKLRDIEADVNNEINKEI